MFSNGVVALGVLSAVLVIAFGAREQALLPLYAVGVFMSFTLSQFGMVMRGRRLRQPGWWRSALVSSSRRLPRTGMHAWAGVDLVGNRSARIGTHDCGWPRSASGFNRM